MSTQFDSIILNGQSLRPAPYVNTSYEYFKAGDYIIGGFLIVTLSGQLVGEDILTQMQNINTLQNQYQCVSLVIGCGGNSDFLNGSGRIRSVDVSSTDQPFLASYTIQVAVETIDGQPVVEPDEDFLQAYNLSNVKFIQNYSENITLQGDGSVITSTDSNGLGISKSYVKASGKITITCYGREICGIPGYNGLQQSIDILKQRAQSLLSFNFNNITDHPLSSYSSWNKWLDTRSLEIDSGAGTASWTFDLYLSKGSCQPLAWVDVTIEDKQDQRKKIQTRSINGTIKGLSSANLTDLLNDTKLCVNERMTNANAAYQALQNYIINGNWPSDQIELSGLSGNCNTVVPPNSCGTNNNLTCYQRMSSNITHSKVAGEIIFNAEFADIPSCKPRGIGTIDVNVDEQFPANRHVEFIIPNNTNSVIQIIGDTPRKVTIDVRGTLNGCDRTKLEELKLCVQSEMNRLQSFYNGWILLKQKKTTGTVSYNISRELIKCDVNT